MDLFTYLLFQGTKLLVGMNNSSSQRIPQHSHRNGPMVVCNEAGLAPKKQYSRPE